MHLYLYASINLAYIATIIMKGQMTNLVEIIHGVASASWAMLVCTVFFSSHEQVYLFQTYPERQSLF